MRNEELKRKVEGLKTKLNFSNDFELLDYLVINHIDLDDKTEQRINIFCESKKSNRSDLLSPTIEKYINVTLKNKGVFKDPNKKTVESDKQTDYLIKDFIESNNTKSKGERKFISASMLTKYVLSSGGKHKTKHNSVIERGIERNKDVISKYHEDNNLTSKSNYFNRGKK